MRVAYNHIRQDSIKQAGKVKQEIIEASGKLADHPEMHPPDKYRKDKDVSFRAFEKHNYRISYFIAEGKIHVLRMRHVRQVPKEY